MNWLKKIIRKWFPPKEQERVWLEDITNEIYKLDKYMIGVSEYKSKLVSHIYRNSKYWQNCLAYLVFTYFGGEVEIDREEFDGYVWHCDPVESEDDFITTIRIERDKIPDED